MKNLDDEKLKIYAYIIASSYRVKTMKTIGYDIKTPTNISKESGIPLNHQSKVLTELKNIGCAECINEEAHKMRLY